MKKTTLLLLVFLATFLHIHAQEDPYLWLEEVDGEKALEFVEAQNKASVDLLSSSDNYQEIYDKTLAIFNSEDRIAYPSVRGNYAYNFWRDKNNPRGIWRRTLLTDYTAGTPKWETLIDIDALSEADGEKWVFKGANGLYPTYDRFLIELSPGGGDAVVIREFDVEHKQFLKDGFFIEEAKGGVSYVDENTLVVSSDFGEGTLTSSGYPRQVKLWKRGTDLKDARLIFEGATTDVGTWGFVNRDGPKGYIAISQALTTFSSNTYVWEGDTPVKLDIPEDSEVQGLLNDQLLIQLKSDWVVDTQTYTTGTLLSLKMTELLKGNKEIHVVLVPDEYSSINQVSTTKNKLLINLLTDVTGNLLIYSFTDDQWTSQEVNTPDFGTIYIAGTSDLSDMYFFDFENFITPSTLYSADAGANTFKPYKSLPAFFDGSKYEVTQYKAKSRDGTLIPYFMVSGKNIKMDGSNPTLVYAYGGFEIAISPFYAASYGVSWLDNGGVFVLANIRGGGEYGPKWHQDGMKEKRQNVFDDLYAVSEDVIAKKVTAPEHLGVMGGSNGGLLVGVAFTQRPDLYNAVVCQVPLLDMQRYHKLLAGASWTGEYGNPDMPEEWAYIKKYSPYHNVKEGMDYPEVFFTTSTRDDRVHPGHARKMVAKMNDMGYKTYYYENVEGGHAGSSTNEQSAKASALTFSYLSMKLK